jgi:O-methyltransferase
MAIVQAGHGHWAPWGRLDEVIRTGRPQTKVALGASVWAYFAPPAGAREGQAFSQAMGGLTGTLLLEAARLIDTGSVEFAVDVGGASGALIHALMKQNAARRRTSVLPALPRPPRPFR